MEPDIWQQIQDQLAECFTVMKRDTNCVGLHSSMQKLGTMIDTAQEASNLETAALEKACYGELGANSHLCVECPGCDNETMFTCVLNCAEHYRRLAGNKEPYLEEQPNA